MGAISFGALFIRFVLGGSAVVLATVASWKLGERAGGVLAAFPAVYLAALLTVSIDLSGKELIDQSIVLSQGAIVGMFINIVVAVIAGLLIKKQGWKAGLMNTVLCWFVFSIFAVLFS